MMRQQQTIEGVVLFAQESRFQLIADDGVAHLFVLAPGAAAEPADLAALHRSSARVRVRFKDAGNLKARIAERIDARPRLAAAG